MNVWYGAFAQLGNFLKLPVHFQFHSARPQWENWSIGMVAIIFNSLACMNTSFIKIFISNGCRTAFCSPHCYFCYSTCFLATSKERKMDLIYSKRFSVWHVHLLTFILFQFFIKLTVLIYFRWNLAHFHYFTWIYFGTTSEDSLWVILKYYFCTLFKQLKTMLGISDNNKFLYLFHTFY